MRGSKTTSKCLEVLKKIKWEYLHKQPYYPIAYFFSVDSPKLELVLIQREKDNSFRNYFGALFEFFLY